MGDQRRAERSRGRDPQAHRALPPAVRQGAEADPDRSISLARTSSVENLKRRAWVGNILTLAIMAVLLFGGAGTVRYWEAWLYLAIFLGISVLVTLDLLRRDPALLERRLKGGPVAEKGTVQRI